MREINQNVATHAAKGQTVVVHDDCEYTFLPGQLLKPIQCVPRYEVKVGDLLCGNKPFKLHVMLYFHLFIFENYSLIFKMNEAKKDKCYDLRFLKGMMIGFLTVKTIKEMKPTADIDEGYLAIIKGMIIPIFGFQNEDFDKNIYLILCFTEIFEVRVAEDEERVNGFGLFVDEAIGDIKISKFK